jgi:hypothetical protein
VILMSTGATAPGSVASGAKLGRVRSAERTDSII